MYAMNGRRSFDLRVQELLEDVEANASNRDSEQVRAIMLQPALLLDTLYTLQLQ
jgi:hypothetical protein